MGLFESQYLLCLNKNYVSINKELEKLLTQQEAWAPGSENGFDYPPKGTKENSRGLETRKKYEKTV